MEDVMISCCSALPAQDFADAEHWLAPADFLTQLDIRPGITVADIGAGVGSYTLPISRILGQTGKVFAIEWRPWMQGALHTRLTDPRGLGNVELLTRRPADTLLPRASCDLVVYADIWHELENHDAVLDEAGRILAVGGRIAISNWRPDALCPPGPPVEHRVSMQNTICTVELKSWSLIKVADTAADGYLLVFEKSDESAQS